MSSEATILVIPDTHVAPGEDNSRAVLLGKYIKKLKPTHIVHIGDLAEMGSMSYHDPIKSCSFQADCVAVQDFLEKLVNAAGPAWDKALSVFIEGNHEYRMRRKVQEMPELEGIVNLEALGIRDAFDDVVEWEGHPGGPGILNINEVLFSHYVQTKMGRAMSGANHARNMIRDWHRSVVVGHSHALNYAAEPLPQGGHLHGVVVGCFFDHDHSWAGQNQKRYWRGVITLHCVKDGQMDVEQVSLHRLGRKYGKA